MERKPLLPPAGHPDFPAKLKALRERAGLSGAELSRRAGISETMVSRYESATREDRHTPRPKTVKAIERELRAALSDMPLADSADVQSNETEQSQDAPVRPLTIAEAKQGLAAALGISVDAIKISIEG